MMIDSHRLWRHFSRFMHSAKAIGNRMLIPPEDVAVACLKLCTQILDEETVYRTDYVSALLRKRLLEVLREYRSLGNFEIDFSQKFSPSEREIVRVADESIRIADQCKETANELARESKDNPFLKQIVRDSRSKDRCQLKTLIKHCVTGSEELRHALIDEVDKVFDSIESVKE